MKLSSFQQTNWIRFFAPAIWLANYRLAWLPSDAIAGITLAAYAIPVSLAYAGLAGLSPQVGIYGYLLGGVGYALFGSSRQLAIGPTSAISLMIAGTVGEMAGGLSGVTFAVGPDRRASRVVVENLDVNGQGTFTRVPPRK